MKNNNTNGGIPMIVAATGHRHFYKAYNKEEILKNLEVWLNHHRNKISHIISGMALGWDLEVAKLSLKMGFPLHCYMAFRYNSKNPNGQDLADNQAIQNLLNLNKSKSRFRPEDLSNFTYDDLDSIYQKYRRYPNIDQLVQTRKETLDILDASHEIHYTDDYYSEDVFLRRDLDMVNNANTIIAYYNEEQKTGGTYYTIKHAKQVPLPIYNFFYRNTKIHYARRKVIKV